MAHNFAGSAMTGQGTGAGSWKCTYCKKLVKSHVEYCPTCWYHWEQVYDPSFVQGVSQKPDQTRQKPTPKSPRRRSGNTTRGQKNQGNVDAFSFPSFPSFPSGKGQSTAAPSNPSPFASTSYSGFQQSTGSPWLAQDGKMQDPGADMQDMIASIRKPYPDPSTMPPDIKAKVEKYDASTGRQIKAELHRETNKLDRARTAIVDLNKSKDEHRRAWIHHLEEAAKVWKQQMVAYQDQQKEYSQLIEKAKSDLESAGTAIHTLKAKAVVAPSITLQDPDMNVPSEDKSHLVKQEAAMRQQIQGLLSDCAQMLQADPIDKLEISDEEEMTEELRQPKRARSAEGQSRMDGSGAFGPAS
eukprot:s10_g9.t1